MADFKKYHVYQELTGKKPERGDFRVQVHQTPEEKSDYEDLHGEHLKLHSMHNTLTPAMKAMRKLGTDAESGDMEKAQSTKEDEELAKDLKSEGDDPDFLKKAKAKGKNDEDEDEDDDDADDDSDDDDDGDIDDMEKSVQDAVGDDVNVHIVDAEVLGEMISKAVQDCMASELRKAINSMAGELVGQLAKSIGEDLKVLRNRTANIYKVAQQTETAQEETLARVDTLMKSFGDSADLVKSITDKEAKAPEAEVTAEAHDKSATATADTPSSKAENIAILTKAFELYQRGTVVEGFDPTSLNAMQHGDFTGVDFAAIHKGLSAVGAV